MTAGMPRAVSGLGGAASAGLPALAWAKEGPDITERSTVYLKNSLT